MATIRLDESKYSLDSRLIKASINVKKLLETFNERISHWETTKNLNLFARTHISGLTYFVTPRKAFIFLNIRQNYLSLKFFTDKSLIEGLKKGNCNADGTTWVTAWER